MAHYSIREIYKAWEDTTLNSLLLGDFYKATDEETDIRPDFIKAYVDVNVASGHTVDKRISRKYGDFVTVEDYTGIDDALAGFIDDNYVYILTHTAELTRMFDALNSKFNPIENYDRYEDTSTSCSESTSEHGSSSESTSEHGSSSGYTSTSTSESEQNSQSNSIANSQTDNVYGWDTNTPSPVASGSGNGGGSASETRGIVGQSTTGQNGATTNDRVHNGTTTNNSVHDALNKVTSHIHGNIGVTKATELIADVLTLYTANGWFDVLVEKVIKDQCILIDYGNNAL